MARPTKRGLDYFPVDCNDSPAVTMVQMECGIEAIGVLYKLLKRIYSDMGYYIKWTEDTALVVCHECNITPEKLYEYLKAYLRRGVFDDYMFKNYGILTSEDIQQRYFEATVKRKNVECIAEYALADIEIWDNVYVISL